MPFDSQIVLIDDDASFCGSVKKFFACKNIPLLTVSDAVIASALNFEKFKVILLDIDMPEISGRELLSNIRASEKPIVIMVSGHSAEETRLSCLNEGADFFFSKPVNLEELSLVVRRAVVRSDYLQEEDSWSLLRSESAIRTPDARVVGLSSGEFRVLEQLIRHAPNPVSKEMLTQAVTGDIGQTASFTRALEVMLSRLRTRASSDAVKLPVKALRNVGYVFNGSGLLEK